MVFAHILDSFIVSQNLQSLPRLIEGIPFPISIRDIDLITLIVEREILVISQDAIFLLIIHLQAHSANTNIQSVYKFILAERACKDQNPL